MQQCKSRFCNSGFVPNTFVFGVDTSVSEWNCGRGDRRNGKERANYYRVEGVGTADENGVHFLVRMSEASCYGESLLQVSQVPCCQEACHWSHNFSSESLLPVLYHPTNIKVTESRVVNDFQVTGGSWEQSGPYPYPKLGQSTNTQKAHRDLKRYELLNPKPLNPTP